MANIPWLRAVLMYDAMQSAWIQALFRDILALYLKPQRSFIAIINWLPPHSNSENIFGVIPMLNGLL